jgi:hypothetical protein
MASPVVMEEIYPSMNLEMNISWQAEIMHRHMLLKLPSF